MGEKGDVHHYVHHFVHHGYGIGLWSVAKIGLTIVNGNNHRWCKQFYHHHHHNSCHHHYNDHYNHPMIGGEDSSCHEQLMRRPANEEGDHDHNDQSHHLSQFVWLWWCWWWWLWWYYCWTKSLKIPLMGYYILTSEALWGRFGHYWKMHCLHCKFIKHSIFQKLFR